MAARHPTLDETRVCGVVSVTCGAFDSPSETAPGEAAGGQAGPTAAPWSPYLEQPARRGLSCRPVGAPPLLGLRGHLPRSDGIWGSGLRHPLERQRQRAERSAAEGGREVGRCFQATRRGQGFCVTEVRPGSGAELPAPPADPSGRLRGRRKRNALNLR